MSEESLRQVRLSRVAKGEYEAVNGAGARLRFGAGADTFSPVELLLTAIAGCSAADVDYITAKRSEPDRFTVTVTGDKIRDEHGNRMADLVVTFDIGFPDDEDGDAARAVLPDAVRKSHDRLCTVSRTVELGTPVATRLA